MHNANGPYSYYCMLILESISAAISAWIMCRVLMEPGMIFEKWGLFVDGLANKGLEWIAKPLGYCGVCFSGQWGFWFYLIAWRDRWQAGELIAFTLQTIAAFMVIDYIKETGQTWLNRLKRESS